MWWWCPSICPFFYVFVCLSPEARTTDGSPGLSHRAALTCCLRIAAVMHNYGNKISQEKQKTYLKYFFWMDNNNFYTDEWGMHSTQTIK